MSFRAIFELLEKENDGIVIEIFKTLETVGFVALSVFSFTGIVFIVTYNERFSNFKKKIVFMQMKQIVKNFIIKIMCLIEM